MAKINDLPILSNPTEDMYCLVGKDDLKKVPWSAIMGQIGAPYIATTVAGMTDKTRVYVYQGSESGYTSGNWYYWNGSAWTSGGTYNSAAVDTDKTLTQSDKPADSAIVGKEIGSLKESLVDVTTSKTGKNLFKLTDGRESSETYFNVEFENGLITVSKGAKDYNNYLKLNTKRTVTLEKGTYTFSIQNVSDDVNMGYIRLRDGNTEIASLSLFGSNLGITSKTFILNNTSELTLEIEVNCAKLSDTPKSFNLQIEQGTKKTQYEVYTEEKLINVDKINYEESSINKLKLDNLTINCDNYCTISIKNEIIQIQKGNKSFQTGAYITKKIATMNLKKGNYSISAQDIIPAEERQLVSTSFKINDTEIENSSLLINIPSYMSRIVTLDKDAIIDVYITLIGDDLNKYFANKSLMSFKLMINEGTFSSSWTKYEDDILFGKNIYLPRYVKNELYNLKWNGMGDSLTSAIGTAINYLNYISGKYCIVPRNYGIAGSSIASGTDSSNPMVERYVNMDDDADIITIFGGTNDYGAQIKLGEDDSTDTSTFKGALNVIIDGLIRKYPGKRIGFITPIQRADIYKTVPLETYVNAMVKICANKSIPCLDLYHNGNLNPAIDIIANTFFRVNVSSGSDKLHLNEKGHLVISRIIDDFLHRL